jgi:hypothetical protein
MTHVTDRTAWLRRAETFRDMAAAMIDALEPCADMGVR